MFSKLTTDYDLVCINIRVGSKKILSVTFMLWSNMWK